MPIIFASYDLGHTGLANHRITCHATLGVSGRLATYERASLRPCVYPQSGSRYAIISGRQGVAKKKGPTLHDVHS